LPFQGKDYGFDSRWRYQDSRFAPEPTRLTLDELAQFKKMFEDSRLAKYVKMAGIGGLVLMVIELVRVGPYLYQHFK
jgi:hypothetical protein